MARGQRRGKRPMNMNLDMNSMMPQAFQKYWYVFGTTDTGQPVFLGPYNSEGEATNIAVEKFSGDYEVVGLNTRDRSRATQEMRHKLIARGSSLSKALTRMKHS